MKQLIIYIIMFAMAVPVKAQRESIEELLKDGIFQTSIVGIDIYDLTDDSTVYTYNERQTLRPGSTMKCLTAITALDKLGGDYRYATTCTWDGTVVKRYDAERHKHRVLVGNITVIGGMDPLFGTDDMNAFVMAIQNEKIDTIYGRIVSDISMKDTLRLGRGWCWDDNNPRLTPLLWKGKDEFIRTFEQRLRDAGIMIVNDSIAFRKGKKVSGILDTRYHTISQVLIPMMKRSNNLYAETLFYQIAAMSGKPYASANIAIDTIKSLMGSLGHYGMSPECRQSLADGSGLSLYNYLSPELEVAFLRYAYRNKNIFTHLLPSLPIAGEDGTLEKRMTESSCRGHVMAKTGTLTGVSSLAGYVFTESGKTLCFSIMHNGVLEAGKARDFQDKMCDIMFHY